MSEENSVKTSGGAPSRLWSLNAMTLLKVIANGGPLGRPEITKISGLSRTTITQTVGELVERGIVRDIGLDTTRRGPAATLYDIDPDWSHAWAIDIGHHKIRIALLNFIGQPVASGEVECPASTKTTQDLVRAITGLTKTLFAEANVDQPPEFGVVGVGAVVDPETQTLSLSESMPGKGIGLVAQLNRALGIELCFENDVNLAALAELQYGIGKDTADFVYLSLGFGLGAGVIIDGELKAGWRGAAGELSYLPGTNWRQDGGLGEESIATDARRRGLKTGLSPEEIFTLAAQGNDDACLVIKDTADRLAPVVATVALVLDPQKIVLGGSIGKNNSLLLPYVLHSTQTLYPEASIELESAHLGSDAVIKGAIAQAWNQMRQVCFKNVCALAPADSSKTEKK